MLLKLKILLFNFTGRRIFGKDACIFWALSPEKPVSFFIAENKVRMNEGVDLVSAEIKRQLKRVPAKVLPFRRRGEEVYDDEEDY